MPPAGDRPPPEDPTGWMSTVWTLTVIFGAATAAAFALPSLPGFVEGPVTARALFHPEWMVAATFLVLPLYWAVRLSWRTALVLVPVVSAHLLYIADSAVDASRQMGLVNGISPLWYAVAFAQIGLFAIVGGVGAHRNLVDRRWVKFMKLLTTPANSSAADSASGARPNSGVAPTRHRLLRTRFAKP